MKIKTILYSLITSFILIISYFLVSAKYDLSRNFFLILAILGLTFLTFGIILIIKARKKKGKLRIALLITGISATAPFIGSILHNVFYGLAIAFESLNILFEILHVSFFIISLLVAPILFVVGMVISIKLTGQKGRKFYKD
ncbi:hypothetical protein HOD61_00900 [archaeon]|jgi:hypothetical protein|nr:hypothetical protein [archaeon]